MYAFGEIDKSSTVIKTNRVNFTQNLNTGSLGIQSIKIISGSKNTNYWKSLNNLFYTSGSPSYVGESKFNLPFTNFTINQKIGKQFLTKYHGYDSSSLISVPSKYYGESIKKNSFVYKDLNNTDINGINPIIRDDGFGNLYSTNAHHSQSNKNSSSIDNYVGNIFYDHGLILITETGSWSGSVKYPNLSTNYSLKFDSQNTITTHEYNVNILPQEFNNSMNYTSRCELSGSKNKLNLSTSTIDSNFTSSDWQPYITTINLYQDGDKSLPVIQARLPKPIRKSDKINMRFKIKLDL